MTAATRSSAPADSGSAPMIDPSAIADPARGSEEATVIGRLRWLQGPLPNCGRIHFVAYAQYEIERVELGEVTGKYVFVAHGCPELPRPQYRKDAGSLTTFRIGDRHRLVLARLD